MIQGVLNLLAKMKADAGPGVGVEEYVDRSRDHVWKMLRTHGVYLHGGHAWVHQEPHAAMMVRCTRCEARAGYEYVFTTPTCKVGVA